MASDSEDVVRTIDKPKTTETAATGTVTHDVGSQPAPNGEWMEPQGVDMPGPGTLSTQDAPKDRPGAETQLTDPTGKGSGPSAADGLAVPRSKRKLSLGQRIARGIVTSDVNAGDTGEEAEDTRSPPKKATRTRKGKNRQRRSRRTNKPRDMSREATH